MNEQADLACITEVWLGEEDGVALSELCPSSFKVQQQQQLGDW